VSDTSQTEESRRFIDLADPAEQERLSPSGIAAFLRISGIWSLDDSQALGLLGAATPTSLHEWAAENERRTLGQDAIVRISYLIGIYKALNVCHGKELADAWITLPNRNPIFAGKAPIDYMIENGLRGLATVRQLLEARCQGQ